MVYEVHAPTKCCRWFHRWRYVWGEYNRYFECERCPARQVRLGRHGYQPIEMEWLYRMPKHVDLSRPKMPTSVDAGLPLPAGPGMDEPEMMGSRRLTVPNDAVAAEAAPELFMPTRTSHT